MPWLAGVTEQKNGGPLHHSLIKSPRPLCTKHREAQGKLFSLEIDQMNFAPKWQKVLKFLSDQSG